MMKFRVYIDTSVIGGCLDDEFREDSLRLFREFADGIKIVMLSDLLFFELENAPGKVKNILKKIPTPYIDYVALDEESIELANTYIKEGVVAEKSLSDARHIAIATVERADVLVSWNFKHIVNLQRIHRFNSVNLRLGYPLLEIRSPREVLK
jgi:hypothetical protein